MKYIYWLFIFITFQQYCNAQDCHECESGAYTIDTNEVIQNIRSQYQLITNLKENDFDYIFNHQYDDGCNEPNTIYISEYFYQKKRVLSTETEVSSGEGNYYTTISESKYYYNNKIIFSFISSRNKHIGADKITYTASETRIYYDGCGKVFRKLYKAIEDITLGSNETIEKKLQEIQNKDITKGL